jgi:hypothetical protein
MDTGGDFGADLIDRFNGHFFQSVESLPLEPDDVTLLIEAAGFDWSAVEPSIFGTLLVRALDPVERHRLGAEYTPREYIERLVEPTVLEPLRARWAAVEARVKQLESDDAAPAGASLGTRDAGIAGAPLAARDPRPARTSRRTRRLSKPRREALAEVQSFHAWLRGLRFLDPACGSGNFLYVTMAAVKELELEVIREIERLGAREGTEQTEQILDEVHPRQFWGIEVSWWAREIAELTLWIGYHQFWRRVHGGRTPPVPILEDTGTIACRDAILAWNDIVHRPEKDRPDPTPRIRHPVTGELVPDPEAKLKYMEYVGARPAEWPEADFIVGNPPYIGEKRQRDVLGDGYVNALRDAYSSEEYASSDLVMYWWARAAMLVAGGKAIRAGLITTNSIAYSKNRVHVQSALDAGCRILWATPDHPWVDEKDGAAVRVAMTVLGTGSMPARLVTVAADGHIRTTHREHISPSMGRSPHVAEASSRELRANEGLCWQGFKLVGDGFLLEREEAERLIALDPRHVEVIRPWRNGRDLAKRPRDLFAIDFGIRTESEAAAYPLLFDMVRDRVKPMRDANPDRGRRENWWRYGRTNENLRESVDGLAHYVVTLEVSRQRFFTFLPSDIAPDGALVIIASESQAALGYLSAQPHLEWALAAGGRLGVGNDPRYNKNRCFDAFPFPDPPAELRERIGAVAERLDQHRKDALARDESVTMTGMYNVVEKLRGGEALTPKERKIHEIAACGVLKDLHDELDALVAEAYGWPSPMEREEILERLVALHDERVEEEKRGVIRWLRPEYQIPRFAPDHAVPPAELDLGEDDEPAEAVSGEVEKLPWPATAVEQLEAITSLASRGIVSVDGLVGAFEGADRRIVARHLETLVLLGEVG